MAISTSKSCPHCGDDHKGKPFALYEDGYHCFSCGSTKRAIRNFTLRGLVAHESIELPELTLNPSMFSLSVLKWLRKYHVSDETIYKHCIAEATDNSVIAPVLDVETGNVIMYQRRWFDPRRIMTYGSKQPFIAKADTGNSVLVIVEDFISAIRVGEIEDCYCMFGTAIPYHQLETLVKTYSTIVVWADGDSPGQNAARKIHQLLMKIQARANIKRAFDLSSNKTTVNVVTEKDPKCYTNTEILKILKTNGVSYESSYENSR